MVSPKLDLRAEQSVIDRVNRLAARLSHPGAEVSRSAAARAALLRGLESFEAEHDAVEQATKARPKTAQKGGKRAPRKA